MPWLNSVCSERCWFSSISWSWIFSNDFNISLRCSRFYKVKYKNTIFLIAFSSSFSCFFLIFSENFFRCFFLFWKPVRYSFLDSESNETMRFFDFFIDPMYWVTSARFIFDWRSRYCTMQGIAFFRFYFLLYFATYNYGSFTRIVLFE